MKKLKGYISTVFGSVDRAGSPAPVRLLNLGMQFFAEGEEGDNGDGGTGDDGNTGRSGNSHNENEPPKTFTQDDVTKMMATEKQQGNQAGQNATLEALGVTTVAEAQKIINAAKTLLGAGESGGDGDVKPDPVLVSRLAEAEAKAIAAERKLYLISENAKALSEYHASIIILAEAQMKSDVTLTFELAVDKVRELHKGMFLQDKGTGDPPGAGRQSGGNTQGYGARAAAINKQSTAKSSFFKQT